MIFGIDISVAQPVSSINWARATAEGGVQFAYLRQGYGTKSNPNFLPHHAAAAPHLDLLGAYQFALIDADPCDEARAFCSSVGALDLKLPPVLDLETRNGASPQQTLDWADQWVAEVLEQLGRRARIYTGANFWQSLGAGGTDPKWRELGLFVANYGVASPHIPPPWTSWEFWQFAANTIWQLGSAQKWGATCPGPGWRKVASSRPIAGVTGEVDCDWFNGTLEELRAL